MLFLGIISWKGATCFKRGCFSDWGRASFLSGGAQWGILVLMEGGVSRKIVGWEERNPPPPDGPPLWETLGGDVKNAVWRKTLQQKEVIKKLSHVVRNLCLAL